jgi:hypothetical protein
VGLLAVPSGSVNQPLLHMNNVTETGPTKNDGPFLLFFLSAKASQASQHLEI